ncbi:MAG: ABC transporter ATP-binding protein [Propionibacteriaceae bacterium]|jgi:simple sugar transport system ATP-binding protein|nr:ABC transporter ATP-binding protein [Propionibacteriaceae bacterium]
MSSTATDDKEGRVRLELRQITKRFGGFTANDAIDLVVEPGQIHALLGENGAGKSTLMNVLFGLYAADGGDILLDGQPVRFNGPGEAMAAGIGMVHQHFMLVPVFTVAENVVMGHEPVKVFGLIDLPQARALVKEISDRFHFDVDPDALVENLPVGVQQRVEIIKALSRQAKILILDEPTAVLTPQETDELMAIMRQLKAAGTSIVFITHKLREVREVADTITVIRHGKVVGVASPTASQTELASLMVGRSVDLGVAKAPARPGPAALEVQDLSLVEPSGLTVLDDVSFAVERGEILAIAGVQGNGQTELTQTLLGLRQPTAGSIRLDGRELAGLSVHQVLDYGVGFVPEDRSKDGMVASFMISENLVLDQVSHQPYSRAGALDIRAIGHHASAEVERFDIRTRSAAAPIATLSGGNQQKVVLARELSRELRLFIASQPTRGLDVGSIEFIHARIVQERDKGTPVIIVSTELDEVLALADRIAVMYRGRFVGIVPPDTSRGVLGLMMAGVPYEEALAAGPPDAPDPAAAGQAQPAGPAAARPHLAETQEGGRP